MPGLNFHLMNSAAGFESPFYLHFNRLALQSLCPHLRLRLNLSHQISRPIFKSFTHLVINLKQGIELDTYIILV